MKYDEYLCYLNVTAKKLEKNPFVYLLYYIQKTLRALSFKSTQKLENARVRVVSASLIQVPCA